MDLEQIKEMEPIDRLAYWITERESIRLKKEAEEPKPWTDDVILQSYRFCNARRMDDKVSRWLWENWYKPHLGHPNMFLAVALARFINLPSSLEKITGVMFAGEVTDKAVSINWELIKEILREHRDAGNTIFNGAYMVRGNDGMDKIECVIDYYVRPLTTLKIYVYSMEETHANIMTSYGMGSFMAGQITADLRWAVNGSWDDKCDWAPMGPGSQRGLNWVTGHEISHKWKQVDFLRQLRSTVKDLDCRLSKPIKNRLELIDYQSTLCEQDKFCRALFGTGKPKQKYPGKG